MPDSVICLSRISSIKMHFKRCEWSNLVCGWQYGHNPSPYSFIAKRLLLRSLVSGSRHKYLWRNRRIWSWLLDGMFACVTEWLNAKRSCVCGRCAAVERFTSCNKFLKYFRGAFVMFLSPWGVGSMKFKWCLCFNCLAISGVTSALGSFVNASV